MRTAQVAARIGVSETTLDRWAARGMVHCTIAGKGRGDRRWWSHRDLLVAQLCRDLLESGLPAARVGEATRLAAACPSWEDQVLVVTQTDTELWPLENARELLHYAGGVVRMDNLGARERALAVA